MRILRSKRGGEALGAAITLLLFGLAVWALHREAGQLAAGHLTDAVASLDPARAALAICATVAGYAVLTLYDVVALHVIGRPLPYRAAAEGAFLGFAVSHNVGLGWLSGGAIRQRIYGPRGLSVAGVAQLTVVNSVTFFLGTFSLLGATLLVRPDLPAALVPVPTGLARLIGILLLCAVIVYLVACALDFRALSIGGATLKLPPWRIAAAQILLSCFDLALAAAALHFALPASLALSFPDVLGVYIVALSASLVTQVPGGVGVFEALVLMVLPAAPRAPLLAGLLLFRAIYYIVPLAIGLLWMLRRSAPRLWGIIRPGLRRVAPFVPLAAAAVSLLCGGVLLLSGATPVLDERLRELRQLVPLPLLEISHMVGSVVGVMLVVLAHALYRRYNSARTTAVALLMVGAFASILKGGDWEQALLLGAAAGLLIAFKGAFYRSGSFWRTLGSPAWILTALAVIGLSIVVGLAAYSDVAYRDSLWWQVTYRGDAPRFLRASLAALVLGLGLLAARLLHSARQPRVADAPSPLIEALVAGSSDSAANLAFLGDKRFLMSESGLAFLMYQIEGTSWIAMGDPVGARAEWPDLVWAFRDLADRYGGRPVFYEVAGDHLHLYADAGLVGHKVGEEARVNLTALRLDSPQAKGMRAARRRGDRHGLSFAVIPAADVPDLLPTLRAVSEDWLAAKGGREKGFSLGFFEPAYLVRFDCAVVRLEGRIVAFANIWRGGLAELSVDLMRHLDDAPRAVMQFLFVELMLWGKDRGYQWFNLGMAPLAGLADHRLAPTWHRIGRFAYARGERLYGFDGLRRFKQQFHPEWRSRYVVCRPTSAALATALRDAARLIGRPKIGPMPTVAAPLVPRHPPSS